MSVKQLIDIHTHQSQKSAISIQNIIATQKFQINRNDFYSIGFHPWYLPPENEIQTNMQQLKNIIQQNKHIIAIGECGLDSACQTDMVLQQQWFSAQLFVAQQTQKPIIIHNVKMQNQIIKLLKEQKIKNTIIFHGFNGSYQEAMQCIRHNIFLSFGKSILNKKTKATKYLQHLPLDHIFLETDDSRLHIKEIYHAVANLYSVDIESVQKQISYNFKSIFNK